MKVLDAALKGAIVITIGLLVVQLMIAAEVIR